MDTVAQHLRTEAIKRTNVHEKDVFGRSAFNRYYYATYLLVKAKFASFRVEWAELSHAQIPDMLRKTIKTTLTKGRQRAQKADDIDVFQLCQRAISAAEDLARLMEEGRATRVVADYHPDLLVDFSVGTGYELNTVSVQKAQTWPSKAHGYLSTISSAWKQLNA
jgi:hypothetical protein